MHLTKTDSLCHRLVITLKISILNEKTKHMKIIILPSGVVLQQFSHLSHLVALL